MDARESSDGFVPIRRGMRATAPDHVTFSGQTCTAPVPPGAGDATRADWAWNGNGLLRLRFGQTGDYVAYRNSRNTRAVTATQVRRVTGRPLEGRIPIERIDGNDIYIRIEEPAEARS
jgi:hypothetical protein